MRYTEIKTANEAIEEQIPNENNNNPKQKNQEK